MSIGTGVVTPAALSTALAFATLGVRPYIVANASMWPGRPAGTIE